MKTETSSELIAPCGMNCANCAGYLACKNDVKDKGIKMPYCTGCRPRNKKCAFLKKRCSKLANNEVRFCFECSSFPCDRLKTIDSRYRSRYRMSMIENLNFIKRNGIEEFLDSQEKSWKCKSCGEMICCHNGICFNCGLEKLRNKKNKYRWNE
jgi:Protein of unknown function (DUF3795)